MLAGIPVSDDDTETLADLLRVAELPDTADNSNADWRSGREFSR